MKVQIGVSISTPAAHILAPCIDMDLDDMERYLTV